MKKAGFSLASFLILLILITPNSVFADDIVTGNQSIESHTININDNGSVTSKVETTVNGKTDVEESNQPGELDVKNINGTITITKNPNPTITINPTVTIIATHSPIINEEKIIHKNIISSFLEKISSFLKRILRDL